MCFNSREECIPIDLGGVVYSTQQAFYTEEHPPLLHVHTSYKIGIS
jgi:hypothetical protein